MSEDLKSEDFKSGEEVRQQIIDFVRETVGPREGMKPDLVFVVDVIRKTIPQGVLKGKKLEEFNRAIKILWDMRDYLGQIETMLRMYWPVEQVNEDE